MHHDSNIWPAIFKLFCCYVSLVAKKFELCCSNVGAVMHWRWNSITIWAYGSTFSIWLVTCKYQFKRDVDLMLKFRYIHHTVGHTDCLTVLIITSHFENTIFSFPFDPSNYVLFHTFVFHFNALFVELDTLKI